MGQNACETGHGWPVRAYPILRLYTENQEDLLKEKNKEDKWMVPVDRLGRYSAGRGFSLSKNDEGGGECGNRRYGAGMEALRQRWKTFIHCGCCREGSFAIEAGESEVPNFFQSYTRVLINYKNALLL